MIATLRKIATAVGVSALLAAGVVTSSPAHAEPAQIARVNNFLTMKYGVFAHYVPGLTTDSSGVAISDINTLANNFDATGFANDLASWHVEYVKFTAWHANMIPLYPSSVQTTWRGSGTSSTRDLIGDMVTAVKAKGIAVILYTHPRVGHSFSNADMIATGWGNGGASYSPNPNPATFDFTKWNNFVYDSYSELLSRYGSRIDGVYVDEGDGYAHSYNIVDYPRLRALFDQYQNLALLHNYFGNLYSLDIADKELAHTGAFANNDGSAWPNEPDKAATVLLAPNWWATTTSSTPAISYTAIDMFRYTVLQAASNKVGGGTAWAAGPYAGGGWESGVNAAMTAVGAYIAPVQQSISGTYPSQAYPTADGATVGGLTWGVATRSPDDLITYIHVLKPPTGSTLSLPVPANGQNFQNARLLVGGSPVTLSQTSSGVSLTLPTGASWSSTDTVIALTTAAPSVGVTVTTTSSLESSDWGAAKAVDGNILSTSGDHGWTSSSNLTQDHTESITLDMGASTTMSGVTLSPRSDASDRGQGFPVALNVATSSDGTTWTTRATDTNIGLPNAPKVYNFSRATARFVRVRGTQLRANPNDSNQYRMVLAEVTVRDQNVAASNLYLTNAFHHRLLQGTAAAYGGSSTTANDIVIVPGPNRPGNSELTWNITDVGGGYYTITNVYRGWRLTGTADNYPGRTDVNTVVESNAALFDAQLWQIIPGADGRYRIINKQLGMALHGTGARYPSLIDINSVVMVPSSWYTDEQRWTIGR